MAEIPKAIDIRRMMRSSNSGFFRNLPGFIITGLEKLICQDAMNDIIFRHRDKTGIPFINDVLEDWHIKSEIKGIENIPSSGRFIFVANHPLGAIDGLVFLSAIGKFHPDVVSPVNEMIDYVTSLSPVMMGINVYGKNSRETAERLNNLFESDKQVMMFPSGEVSRKKNGIISDPVWQKSFVTKAVQFKRDIMPVHISGRNSNLFYRVANLRTFLGIKMYIESALLPREMLKQLNSTVTITFGRVIPFAALSEEKTPQEWTQDIRDIVYKLGEEGHSFKV